MLHSLRQTAQTYKRIPSGNTSLPNNVGGQGRKTSIAYFSTKRNRNEHIPPARGRKPLPMGEVALRSNDGEGKPGTKEPLRSDGQALCQRETSAAPVLPRQQPCPLRRSRASSPKGRALGRPVKFPLDEQSLFVSWTVVPCCPGQRQLDKVRRPEAAALCSKARFFAPYCASGVQ